MRGKRDSVDVSLRQFTGFCSTAPSSTFRFGADYLRWVRDHVYENPVAALAGYNAGPGNARTWFDRSAPDEALFIERIPYNETRLCLLRILTHYSHYLRIYGGF